MICDDCGSEFDMFMLHDSVWLFACKDRATEWELLFHPHSGSWFIDTLGIVYCQGCVEKRIGRPLEDTDYKIKRV